MPNQIKEALLKKSLKAETATIGHKRHMGLQIETFKIFLIKKLPLQEQL